MGRAWTIFMHPRRTAEELTRLESEVAGLKSEASGLRKSLADSTELVAQRDRTVGELRKMTYEMAEKHDKLDGSVKELSKNLLEMRSRLDSKERELADTRELLRAKEKELEENNDIQARMSEIETTLAGAEDMKRHYEDRVRRLRAKIVELKSRTLNPEPTPSANEVIDMTNSIPPAPDDPDADWLMASP